MPSAPRNLQGKFLDDDRTLHLTWDEPTDKPGSVISYAVNYSVAGENKYKQV